MNIDDPDAMRIMMYLDVLVEAEIERAGRPFVARENHDFAANIEASWARRHDAALPEVRRRQVQGQPLLAGLASHEAR